MQIFQYTTHKFFFTRNDNYNATGLIIIKPKSHKKFSNAQCAKKFSNGQCV